MVEIRRYNFDSCLRQRFFVVFETTIFCCLNSSVRQVVNNIHTSLRMNLLYNYVINDIIGDCVLLQLIMFFYLFVSAFKCSMSLLLTIKTAHIRHTFLCTIFGSWYQIRGMKFPMITNYLIIFSIITYNYDIFLLIINNDNIAIRMLTEAGVVK